MFIKYKCKECGKRVRKQFNATLPGVYCSRICKSNFQRRAKPVSRAWLVKHYIKKKLDCVKIGKIVGRDPKSVWNWLKDFKIQTRPRGHDTSHLQKGRPAGFKQSDETKEKIRAIALATGRVPYDPKVGSYMKGKKGAQTTNWKGGITPERQAVHSSKEWMKVSKLVWKRDSETCQQCGRKQNNDRSISFDVHHIEGFEVKQLRCTASNLVLICEPCHHWIHSKKNTKKLWLK